VSVPVAHVIRSGFVEGVHYGSAVVTDVNGDVLWSVGNVASPMFPRSANKFMQALAMIEARLPLRDELLAIACASHSGEPFHIEAVRQILHLAQLGPDALRCPADYPLDQKSHDEFIRDDVAKQPIYMNCSGKHAAMLYTCVVNGWDLETYKSPSHPLQLACKKIIEEVAGESVTAIGIDGCGTPVMSLTLTGLARSFGKFTNPSATENQKLVATAVKNFPQYVGGTYRDVTKLMQGVPDLICKDGAEGVYAIALGDGRALALKIDDGADRARIAVAMSILRNVLGVVAQEIDRQLERRLVYGDGEPVGKIQPLV
jgi:L-asparaginase II